MVLEAFVIIISHQIQSLGVERWTNGLCIIKFNVEPQCSRGSVRKTDYTLK